MNDIEFLVICDYYPRVVEVVVKKETEASWFLDKVQDVVGSTHLGRFTAKAHTHSVVSTRAEALAAARKYEEERFAELLKMHDYALGLIERAEAGDGGH
jgi:hypothetical protein